MIEYFYNTKVNFDPAYVYEDVCKAVRMIHTSGVLYQAMMKDLPRYLKGKRPVLSAVLSKLKSNGRKVTNLITFHE